MTLRIREDKFEEVFCCSTAKAIELYGITAFSLLKEI
jgi:hypothetical protein